MIDFRCSAQRSRLILEEDTYHDENEEGLVEFKIVRELDPQLMNAICEEKEHRRQAPFVILLWVGLAPFMSYQVNTGQRGFISSESLNLRRSSNVPKEFHSFSISTAKP